jgi:hypothetical protein
MRAVVDEGLVSYLVVMLLVGAALLVSRGLYVLSRPESEKAEALRGLLRTESEPLRPEQNAALATGLLYGFERWDVCSRGNADLRAEIGCAYHLFSELYQAGKDVKVAACPLWNANRKIVALHDTRAHVDFHGRGVVPFGVGSGRPPVRISTAIEPAMTESGSHTSRLIIPSTISTEARQCEERITRALRRSQALEALQPALEQVASGAKPYNPTIQSYYFVSFDGFLRTVPNQPLEALVPHRPFNHTSYVVDTLQIPIDRELVAAGVLQRAGNRSRQACTAVSEDVYVSRAYLDTYGNGIVQTICNRVILKPAASSLHRAPERRAKSPPRQTGTSSVCSSDSPNAAAALEMQSIAEPNVEGVFCADIGVARAFIHRALAANPLFDTDLYQLEDEDKNQEMEECKRKPPRIARCTRSLVEEAQGSEEQFDCDRTEPVTDREKAKVLAWWCDEKEESSSGYAGITWLDKGAHEHAAVVWDNMPPKERSAHVAQVAVIRPKRPFATGPRIIVVMLLFAISIAVAARTSAMHAKRRSEDLLRGLQVGLVKVNESDGIVGANARAESILDAKLPRFGMHVADPELARGRRRFVELIDSDLRTEPGSRDRFIVRKGAGGFVRSSYSEMSRLRERGISSEYCVRIVKRDGSKAWVEIMGSPMLPSEFGLEEGVQVPGTYGVVERVDERIWPDLERTVARSEDGGTAP